MDIPPRFGEVNLTPEEPEALRKKEERLHRNYLRRKGGGKQKEYEDRIKSEKRRRMAAKKAALRAEDMAACSILRPAYHRASHRKARCHLAPLFDMRAI